MATEINVWWLMLFISNVILCLLCISSLKQCCNSTITDKKRCHHTLMVALFGVCCIILNTFSYLSSMLHQFALFEQAQLLPVLSIIFEAITSIVGFHIFCLFHQTILKGLYKAAAAQYQGTLPWWMELVFKCMELFVIVMIIVCYLLAFILQHFLILIVCYICYAVLIFAQCLCILMESRKILNLLNLQRTPSPTRSMDVHHFSSRVPSHRRRSTTDSPKLLTAKRTMHWISVGLVCIVMVCIGDVFINLEMIEHSYSHMKHLQSGDMLLWSNIVRSLFMITLMMLSSVWVYQRDVYCCDCQYETDSVWQCVCYCKCRRYYRLVHSKSRGTVNQQIQQSQKQTYHSLRISEVPRFGMYETPDTDTGTYRQDTATTRTKVNTTVFESTHTKRASSWNASTTTTNNTLLIADSSLP